MNDHSEDEDRPCGVHVHMSEWTNEQWFTYYLTKHNVIVEKYLTIDMMVKQIIDELEFRKDNL